MRKIIFILFSLVYFIGYSQKKNEYGLKMVKSVTIEECIFNYTTKYVFEYDDNNRNTKAEFYSKPSDEDGKYSLLDKYVLENGKLTYYTKVWDGYKDVLIKPNNKYTLNDKGHLIKVEEIFPEEIDVDEIIYDSDASIYDENYIGVIHYETDKNGNYFTGPTGKLLTPHKVSEIDYDKPQGSGSFELKDINDTNIPLYNIVLYGKNGLTTMTTWVPFYNPWLPIRWKQEKQITKFEYYSDKNNNLHKIILYDLNNGIYRLKRIILIEYLY